MKIPPLEMGDKCLDPQIDEINRAIVLYNAACEQGKSYRENLKQIIAACDQYITKVPKEIRGMGFSWETISKQWPHAASIWEIQKKSVSYLFLPEGKSIGKNYINLLSRKLLDYLDLAVQTADPQLIPLKSQTLWWLLEQGIEKYLDEDLLKKLQAESSLYPLAVPDKKPQERAEPLGRKTAKILAVTGYISVAAALGTYVMAKVFAADTVDDILYSQGLGQLSMSQTMLMTLAIITAAATSTLLGLHCSPQGFVGHAYSLKIS